MSQRFDHKYWKAYAEKSEPPAELYKQITDDGFLGIMVPEAYGGAGQGMTEMLLFMEGLANNGIPLLNLVVGPTMTMGLLAKHASETMKRRLPAGRMRRRHQVLLRHHRAQTPVRTRWRSPPPRKRTARGGFRLTGQKVFITDANRARLRDGHHTHHARART